MWHPALRLASILGGTTLALALTIFGATALAQVAGTGGVGPLFGMAAWFGSSVGGYLILAGLWGSWSLGPRRAVRLRTIRVCLAMACLLGLYMIWGLPTDVLTHGTTGDKLSFLILALFVTSLFVASTSIGRYPSQVAWGLLPLALYAFVALIRFTASLILVAPQYAGPSSALSLLLATAFFMLVLAAFRFAWPLRSEPSSAAT